MDADIRVELDGTEPVIVKCATGPGVGRLRQERARLVSAAHPGVVALARSDRPARGATPDPPAGGDPSTRDGDGDQLRTCYAGEPLDRWRGSVTDVAGLVAAVAGTLADLHGVGVVHGRVDPSHILVGDDGRPRLCGFAPVDGATAADDVAAVGRVLAELLDRAPGGPAGRVRRSREAGARRALHDLAARAADPVPTRRPTAGALADAVVAAVPGATLPHPDQRRSRVEPGPLATRATPASGTDAVGASGTGDPVLGDGPDHDPFDALWSLGDDRTDDERWSAAFGDGPPDLVPTPGPSPTPDPTPGPDLTPDPRPMLGPTDPSPTPGPTYPTPGPRPMVGPTDPPAPERPSAPPPRPMAPRAPHTSRDAPGRPAGPAVAADGPHEPGRGRRLALVAGIGLVTISAGAAAVLLAAPRDDPDDVPVAAPGSPAGDCAATVAPAADVDADGCPESLTIDGTVVDAGVARWTLGEPGDRIALGDWDCDGDASAAVLRPSTGDVFLFSAWAQADEPLTVRSTDRVERGVDIRAEPGDGCDRLLVDLPDGTSTAVEVPG